MTDLLVHAAERPTGFEIANPALRSIPDWAYGGDEADAAERGMRALTDMLAHRGRPAEAIDRILAEHPESSFVHALRLATIVRDDNRAAEAALAASIAAISAAGAAAGEPAHRHAAAAMLWLEGDALALEGYAAIVAEAPRDIIALAVAHALDFRLGNRTMLRDRIAQVIGDWDEAIPGYAAVLAMYGFGLEENGAYREAEHLARHALALEPGFAPALHVLAHVMEMEGRAREGLAMLAAHEAAWADGSGFAVHLAWHRALFHLHLNDEAGALAVYDRQIATPATPSFAALADASALLWRLTLRNVDSGARWRRLADRWKQAPLSQARPFFLVHAMMAFAADGRRASAARLLASLPRIASSDPASALPEQALARPFCEAILAFAARDYASCIAALDRVSAIADRCGGSLAQCEASRITLAEATRRAGKTLLAA